MTKTGSVARVVALLAPALWISGCATAPTDEEAQTAAIMPAADDCNPLVCPGNSDVLAGLGIYELDVSRVAWSSRGFRIAAASHQGVAADLDVTGAQLAVTKGGATLTGPAVIGLELRVAHDSGRDYMLKIDGYRSNGVPYYVGGGPLIEGFHIRYRPVGDRDFRELCPYPDLAHVDRGVEGTWAVVWRGERYRPDTGEIFASGPAAGSWINISCAGEATIKAMRAKASLAVNAAASLAQRQATLFMFTASYCGRNGPRFTKLGMPLVWSDLSGPSVIGPVSSIEAVWTATGAACLTTPRLYPIEEVTAVCPLAACTRRQIAEWATSGWLLSGAP